MEIALGEVEAPGNSIELYISHGDQGPSHAPLPIHREMVPSLGGCHEGGAPYEAADGTDSDDAEAVQGQSLINLNSVPEILRQDIVEGIVEVKTCQSNVFPNKGGHVQLVDLVSRICTCQKPQLYGHYYLLMLAVCRHLSIDPHQYVEMCITWQPTYVPGNQLFVQLQTRRTGRPANGPPYYWTPRCGSPPKVGPGVPDCTT